jgi:outer membrane receptor protein involved in Fe transport
MAVRRPHPQLLLCTLTCLAASTLAASEHRGQVLFNGIPVPGAAVTATRDAAKHTAVTDAQGFYSFPDLADATWRFEVTMFGFAPAARDIDVAPAAPPARWELTILPLEKIRAAYRPAASPPAASANGPSAPRHTPPPAAESPAAEDELAQRAAEGFLINGSVNNGNASPFAQAAAFGNNRTAGRGLYNGGLGFILGNSALDARPFSLTGQNTPKSAYNRITGVLSFGGPLQIPRLFKNGPNFFLGYQWTRNSDAATATTLMPDLNLRNGLFPTPLLDPLSGAPFPGNAIPPSRISPQARALLDFYPLPNFPAGARYNYQVPILTPTHQDSLQSRLGRAIGPRDQVYGHFAFDNTRADHPNLFGFLDTTGALGLNTGANWIHRLSPNLFLNLGYQFSRLAARLTPYFQNRDNVSGRAGISGNNQDPANWGPPSLVFSDGIAGLSDAQSSFNRNQTSAVSASMLWNRRSHNFRFGGDFRRQQFNDLEQQDPRGTFTFTGAFTGSGFADFLLGWPAASSVAFGNPDKYFRQSASALYFNDDWRLNGALTLNAGLRWEYSAPITERYGRLVNLDIAPDFTAASPVVAASPSAPLTGRRYPASLLEPDRNGFAPRVGLAWRPIPASSFIVRAGYGIYYDTSVYQTIALQMAQQPPLSKTLRLQNNAANPFTLANALTAQPPATPNTFAVDPDFRIGYAQNWQLSIQRDLPAALQLTALYLGIKGTRGMQQFLPNTYPAGAVNPCPACPSGFAYLASNGNSSRHAAQLQLRRRLRSGLAATLQYTWSKSIDNVAALGGPGSPPSPQTGPSPNSPSAGGAPVTSAGSSGPAGLAIAQNWLDLAAERALSSFDQRHLLTLQLQYTTGMGLGGGALLGGWKGALLKQWTVATQITAGSGLPQTPIYLAPVEGTGFTGTLRPDYTGAPLYAPPSGLFLNPGAYRAPRPGQWGNAGRNSITGPAQFNLNASLGRAFRLTDRLNLDLRVDAANALNRVNYTAWNTIVNNAQFGLPASAAAMRTLQTTLRVRF